MIIIKFKKIIYILKKKTVKSREKKYEFKKN